MTGNEPERRWMAYSRYQADGAEPGAQDERRGFAGKREAVSWLKLQHQQPTSETSLVGSQPWLWLPHQFAAHPIDVLGRATETVPRRYQSAGRID